MRIELLCIGTELLRGKVNTHGAYLSERLAEIGLTLDRETTVADDESDMAEAFRAAFDRSDVVLSTGGLGPTFDDLTREVWSGVLGVPLFRRKSLEADIRDRFRKRGLRMPPLNLRQADVLDGASVIRNNVGTAPGQILEHDGRVIILMPGPAAEMYPMVERTVLPLLRRRSRPLPYGTFTLHTFGWPESFIDHRIRPAVSRERKLGKDEWLNFCILAHSYRVDVRVEARAPRPGRLRSLLGGVRRELLRLIRPEVYGEDEDTLESVVGRALVRRGLRLAVAESCTGGLIGEMLTQVPGSSDYFSGGAITYSNMLKERLLGVRRETMRRHGAVSVQTALEMAEGARIMSGGINPSRVIGLSITGIAGPSGGTRAKPVGLVFIGFSGLGRRFARRFRFHGTREDIRRRSAMTALDLLRRVVSRHPEVAVRLATEGSLRGIRS